MTDCCNDKACEIEGLDILIGSAPAVLFLRSALVVLRGAVMEFSRCQYLAP